MCANVCDKFMVSLSTTRWWFGTRKAYAAERFSRGGSGARAVPAGTCCRGRAPILAPAKASGDSAKEIQRQDGYILPSRLRVDAGGNGSPRRECIFGTLLALFAPD